MTPQKRPLLLGHRGARGEKSIPENSFVSFDLCLEQGCDGFEFDVRLSADNEAVICHDATYRGQAIALTSSHKLGLPLLSDVLQRYGKRAFLDIELKVAGLEHVLVNLIQDHPPTNYVVSSFLPEVLHTVHALRENIPLGLICETRAQLTRWTQLPVQYVIPHLSLCEDGAFAELRSANKKVLVWTVNTPEDIQRFTEIGTDGLISDYPERLVATRVGEKSFNQEREMN